MNRKIIYLIMNIIGFLALLGSTVFLLVSWSHIPDQIPTHYNFAGVADGYGGKGSLIFMMVLAWFMFVLITVLMRFPNTWIMPVKVTADNKINVSDDEIPPIEEHDLFQMDWNVIYSK